MRILVDCMWSSPHNIESDGTRAWFRGFIWDWIKHSDEHFFFVVLPGWMMDRGKRKDLRPRVEAAFADVLAHPRVEAVWAEGHKKQYRMSAVFDKELLRFDELHGDYPWIDVVITGKVCALPQLMMETQSYTLGGGTRRLYVTATSFLFDDATGPVNFTMRRAQAAGWAEADINMWQSPQQMKRVAQETRRFLSAALQSKVATSNRPYLGGLQINEAREYAKPIAEKPQDRMITIWGSALNQAYDPAPVLAEYDRLYSAGHNVVCRICTSSQVAEDGARRVIPERMLKWFEFYGRQPQKSYWALASEAHVMISPAVSGGEYGLGSFELALLGVIPIYEYSPTAQDFVDGYPYVYHDPMELRAILRFLLVEKGWMSDEAQGWLKKQQDFVATISGAAHWPLLERDLKDLFETRLDGPKHALINLIEAATKDADEMTLDQFSKRLAAHSKNKKGLEGIEEGLYGLSVTVYRRVLLLLGWRDVCDAAEPRFVRIPIEDRAAHIAALKRLGRGQSLAF